VGSEIISRYYPTEMIASFGNAVLLIAVFGLFFRGGLERLLRDAPGGDAYAGFAERVREVLQDLGQQDLGRQDPDQRNEEPEATRYEAKLDRIEEGVRSLTGEDVPELRNEIRELRELLLNAGHGREG
jgi:hypothetical protein